MKEFKKWWNKYKTCNFHCFQCHSVAEYCSKESWKAALEWVADHCRGRRSKGLFDLLNEIDQELGENEVS